MHYKPILHGLPRYYNAMPITVMSHQSTVKETSYRKVITSNGTFIMQQQTLVLAGLF